MSKNDGAAKVLVARDVLRADAAGIECDVDTAGGQVVPHRDGSCDPCRTCHARFTVNKLRL